MGYTVLQYRDQLQTALAAVVMQWCTSSYSGKYPSHHDLERNQSHCSAAQKNFQEQCHDAVRR